MGKSESQKLGSSGRSDQVDTARLGVGWYHLFAMTIQVVSGYSSSGSCYKQ